MMNIKGIFAVSLIAMVAMVAGAHTSNAVAAIASQGYVDQQVGLVEEKIPAAITVDSALSSTSTNPVQNKVINTALSGKEVTSNKVTSANYDANVSNDTKYPTVKAVADAIADAATTASDILTTTTVTSSGTGAVLTGVSVTAGKVTLQKGNVQIPSGGKDATSYVSIWVE